MMEMELMRVVEMESKGRGLVASQPLRGGQIILKESPLLLYSAFPLNRIHSSYAYCGHCFKTLSFFSSKCSCCLEVFCSPHCLHSHTPSGWACQTLLRLRHTLSPPTTSTSSLELHQQARFLVAAYNLAINSPSQFQKLLSLHGSPAPDSSSAAPFLHPLLSPPPPHTHFSVDISAALLAKDKLNAFGLMEPFSPVDTGKNKMRSVRAYGIYPNASLFNHDCLPNACRFDYVDSPTFTISNTEITVRMIHDVPAGREICISYFPVNLTYKSRQRRLMEDYGFACHCDRCTVEANWSDQEDDDDDDNLITEQEEEEEEDNVNMEEESENVSMEEEDCSFPHAYFFVRYMCNRNNCWGTLAPLPPSSQSQSKFQSSSSDDDDVVMECNVCGNLQTQKDQP